MASIGTIIPLPGSVAWRGPRDRPAPIERPARAAGADTRWNSESDDSPAGREAAILTKLTQRSSAGFLDARLAGGAHLPIVRPLSSPRGPRDSDYLEGKPTDGSRGSPPARPASVEREDPDTTAEERGAGLSSVKTAIASLLGVVTYPAPATMKVNGRTVTVDLEVDSLSTIASRLMVEARTQAANEAGEPPRPGLHRGEAPPEAALRWTLAAMARSPRHDDSPGVLPREAREPLRSGTPSEMLERFTAIDATMSRIREQATPLAAEMRALGAEDERR